MSRTKRAPWRGVARNLTPSEQEAEGGQIPGQPPKKRLTTSAMIASLAAEGQRTSPAPFGRALVELGKTRPEVIGMTADLAKYTDLHIFAKEYPDRFYQMGMAEQLLSYAFPNVSPSPRTLCPCSRRASTARSSCSSLTST